MRSCTPVQNLLQFNRVKVHVTNTKYVWEFYTPLITAIIKLIMRNNRDRCEISHLSQPITTYGSALTSSQGLAQSFHKDVVMYGFKAFHVDISLGLSTFPSFILLHFIHIYLILSWSLPPIVGTHTQTHTHTAAPPLQNYVYTCIHYLTNMYQCKLSV